MSTEHMAMREVIVALEAEVERLKMQVGMQQNLQPMTPEEAIWHLRKRHAQIIADMVAQSDRQKKALAKEHGVEP